MHPIVGLMLFVWGCSGSEKSTNDADTSGAQTTLDSGDNHEAWASGLSVSHVDGAEIDGVVYGASSRLAVTWSPPPDEYGVVFLDITDQSTG